MTGKDKFNRRHFVRLAMIGAGGVCLLPGCMRSKSRWRFFTDSEARLMDALADQIIPADDWPGGSDSDVTNFIDRQLIGPYIRFQAKYKKGLAAIEKTCKERFGKRFEELDWKEQTLFLETMEAGKMKGPGWTEGFDREFFGMIREHSMQSFYGSPRHGGNKNNISYKMLKLDYPLIIGQNRYNT